MSFIDALQTYKQYELKAHIELDDVIIKVSQELLEMLEAKHTNDAVELEKETADTIVNILSASYEVGIIPNEAHITKKDDISDIELLMHMKERLQWIQSIRKRYSRDRISKGKLTTLTEEFLSQVLSYSNVQTSLKDIIQHNTDKFSQRIDAYKANVNLKDFIEEYSNFPKAPVLFKDISPLLKSPEAMKYLCFELAEKAKWADIIAWLDARWFLFWPKVAELLNIPFMMVRKSGKLPGQIETENFEKEYGTDCIEIQSNSISEWDKVVILDDLLATGGTANAAAQLIEKTGWVVHKILCVAQIDDEFCSNKRNAYQLSRYPVESILHYEQ